MVVNVAITHRREDSDDDEIDGEMNISIAVQPLVQSLQDLADSQRCLVSERALDREHREKENSRKRRFQRHSFWLMRLGVFE